MTQETNPTLARKVVVEANLTVFLGQFAEAIKDGWDVDPNFPGDVYGYLYEVHLLKDESLIDKTPTRADILANARSAKKLKGEKPAEKPVEAPTESLVEEKPADPADPPKEEAQE